MLRGICVVALGLAAATAAVAQDGSERLVQGELSGFEIGYSASQGPFSIEERVPHGESVHQWTRMVTTQRFGGVASRIAPAQMLERLAAGWAQSCPGATTSQVRSFLVAGRSAAEIRADCPHLASTGLPETMFGRVIAGASDIHMVQVAFRRVPTVDDEGFAQAHLASVALCRAEEHKTPCGVD